MANRLRHFRVDHTHMDQQRHAGAARTIDFFLLKKTN
jgi:hypothetical protein